MSTGTLVILVGLGVLCIYFSGKNVFKNSGGGGKGGSGGGSSSGGSAE